MKVSVRNMTVIVANMTAFVPKITVIVPNMNIFVPNMTRTVTIISLFVLNRELTDNIPNWEYYHQLGISNPQSGIIYLIGDKGYMSLVTQQSPIG